MPSIKISIRLQPSQVYEIEKIAKYFNVNPSVVIRNSIDDYIDIFKTWLGRIVSDTDQPPEKPAFKYNHK